KRCMAQPHGCETSAGQLLLVLLSASLVACASPGTKSPAATTTAPANSVQLTAKPPADPHVPTSFDVALATPSGGAAATNAAAAIGKRIAECWNAPELPGAPAVVLQLSLAEDRTVGAVETVDKRRFASEPAYRAAATAATRAVFQCAPFNLPADSYGAWKSLTLKLTPRQV